MDAIPKTEIGMPERQLMVHAIEDKARWYPSNMYMRYASRGWEQDGYRTITWKQYANAINKVAFWLHDHLGKTTDHHTLAYYGPRDPRYAILLPAVMKIECKLLVPDGRVTKEGLNSLIKATDCKAWLYADDDSSGPLVEPRSDLKMCGLPSLQWMLDSEQQERYPYDKTYEEAKWDEVIIIHTSGTTGLPKPIFQTNGMWSVAANFRFLSRRHWPRGLTYESWAGKTGLNTCPPQWIAGLHSMVLSTVYWDSPCVMMPPDEITLTPDLFMKITKMNKVDGIKCPPSTIVTLYGNPETKEMLKSLEFIAYTGATLDRAIGDDLCQCTRLGPMIGSTENGEQLSINPADKKLWYTFKFVPENGHRMLSRDLTKEGLDDLHELILENSAGGTMHRYQPAFWNPAHRHLERIETKELYRPIMDSDGCTRWAFSARKDDLTKLSWLAKFHAQDIEDRIMQHHEVLRVFVGGEGRTVPYVIIQAKEGVLDKKGEAQLLDELYQSVIAGTNMSDVDEIRIPKETVVIARKEKPLKVSLKQLVLRKAAEEDYLEEIEQAYARLASFNQVGSQK